MKYLSFIVFLSTASCIALGQEYIQISSAERCRSFCKTEDACAKVIADKIQNNWTRPPVREPVPKQMTVTINLLTNGSVEKVSIKNGSGHEKLDNSLLQAVKRADNFCEIQGLTPQEYEKHYKEFTASFIY